MNRKCELIASVIGGLSKDDAADFYRFYSVAEEKSYSWELWGAAYVIHGGCGDDTFSDFRASLISRGRRAFDRALADPESLADEPFDKEAWFYEGFQYAVGRSVDAKLGKRPPPTGRYSQPPSGKEFSEDAVHEIYPKLAGKFA